jgi:hypothetical protein
VQARQHRLEHLTSDQLAAGLGIADVDPEQDVTDLVIAPAEDAPQRWIAHLGQGVTL